MVIRSNRALLLTKKRDTTAQPGQMVLVAHRLFLAVGCLRMGYTAEAGGARDAIDVLLHTSKTGTAQALLHTMGCKDGS